MSAGRSREPFLQRLVLGELVEIVQLAADRYPPAERVRSRSAHIIATSWLPRSTLEFGRSRANRSAPTPKSP